MKDIGVDFFKNLYNDDVIYHYTKASTAIDFILYNSQLKFSSAVSSADPIESKKARRGTVYHSNSSASESKSHSEEINQIHNFVNHLEDNFNQICFCQNHIGQHFANKNYISSLKGNEELFGFTKPRMWDQYADKFTGVCIAFSKKKILDNNDSSLELITGNINYKTFKELYKSKVGDIQGDYLKIAGKDKYITELESQIKQALFIKHIDYSGENEYRIGTLFDKTKCSIEIFRNEPVFDKSIMLNVSNCIEAIFVSSYANKNQKKMLTEYANNLNVRLIEMQWEYDSFEVENYVAFNEFLESIKI